MQNERAERHAQNKVRLGLPQEVFCRLCLRFFDGERECSPGAPECEQAQPQRDADGGKKSTPTIFTTKLVFESFFVPQRGRPMSLQIKSPTASN